MRKALVIAAVTLITPVYAGRIAWGAVSSGSAIALPNINISIGGNQAGGGTAVTLQIMLLLTILSLAPAIVVMVTSFTRIAVVLSLLRQALGTPQIPPNQVLISLALFLTFFIMSPVPGLDLDGGLSTPRPLTDDIFWLSVPFPCGSGITSCLRCAPALWAARHLPPADV